MGEATRTRIGIVGAGFWARYQTAAWREVAGADLVGVADLDSERARALAAAHGVGAYGDVDELLGRARPDLVDVITSPEAHGAAIEAAAAAGVAVLCQKPLAPTLHEAERLVELCRRRAVPLLVHENFRWQAPIRALKRALTADRVGRPFRARLSFVTSFPVFANQPALRKLDQLIIADLGVHLLDVARFLFGDVRRVYAETATVGAGVAGEDVATLVLRHDSGLVCVCDLSFASIVERDCFPQTLALVEAERGSLELAPGFELRVTTGGETRSEPCAPVRYAWADPAYAVVHASMVPCLENVLGSLQGADPAETPGVDNLRTLRLMAAAYESAASGRSVEVASGVAA